MEIALYICKCGSICLTTHQHVGCFDTGWPWYKMVKEGKEGNVLFNDALNTFYLRLYGVGHMVKDHSDSERGNPLPPHGLLFPINSKGYFVYIIAQTG